MNVIHSLPTNWIDMQEDLSVKKNLFPDEREREKNNTAFSDNV